MSRLVFSGTPVLSSTTTVTVRVVDEYEPVFEQQYYTASVPESAARQDAVITVTARCPQGHDLLYTLNPQGPFDVDEKQGTN